MKHTIPRNELSNSDTPGIRLAGNGARDADILVLLWEVFKTRANEIDQLLGSALSILASANDFPQKTEMENALKKTLVLVRT